MPKQLFLLFGLSALLGFSAATHAAVVAFGGQNYESVDWSSADPITDQAVGTFSGVNVNLSAVDIRTNVITSSDYTGDPGFDALTFGGNVESLSINGDITGTTTITFSQPVFSLLVLVGLPGSTQVVERFGPSRWDFDDALTMAIVDTEILAGTPDAQLQLLAGNIVDNSNDDLALHVNGVFSISSPGGFTSISFLQSDIQAGGDGISIALAAIAVPVPAALVAFVSGILSILPLARRRLA